MSISGIGSYSFAFSFPPSIDSEELEIMRQLYAYGETPSGDKTADRAKLHRIETEKAKQENIVSSNKFYTISTQEQDKIQEKKKEKRKEIDIGHDILSNYNKAFIKYNKIDV